MARRLQNGTVFNAYRGKLAAKIYTKKRGVLRLEAMARNARELRCGRSVRRSPDAVSALKQVLERFLEARIRMDRYFVTTRPATV